MTEELTSSRPYLLRAIHEWLSDNGLTPQVIVNADFPGVQVPREHVKDGLIVLNISTSATRGLTLGNDFIEFSARFAGQPRQISVPVTAVLGLHARENGVGMSFPREDPPTDSPGEGGDDDGGDAPPPGGGSRPSLRVVK